MSAKTPYVVIPDDFTGYPLDLFCVPENCAGDLESVLIPGGLVQDRIAKLARDVCLDYKDEPFTALCVLNGAFQFFNALLDEVAKFQQSSDAVKGVLGSYAPRKVSLEFVRVKSYVDSESTEINITGIDNLVTLGGKNVLIIEDIIDTGNTMVKLLEILRAFGPKSIKVVSLLVKRKPNPENKVPNQHGYRPEYSGFEVGPQHVVGWNYDFNDTFRDVKHVCVLSDKGKKKYSMLK